MFEYDPSIDDDLDYETPLFDGISCPVCHGYTYVIGGNYADECQYFECEDCGWMSAEECP